MKGLLKFVERRKIGTGEIEVGIYNHKGEWLGEINYYPRWKRWVFKPDEGTFYDSKCLMKIVEKLNELVKPVSVDEEVGL